MLLQLYTSAALYISTPFTLKDFSTTLSDTSSRDFLVKGVWSTFLVFSPESSAEKVLGEGFTAADASWAKERRRE